MMGLDWACIWRRRIGLFFVVAAGIAVMPVRGVLSSRVREADATKEAAQCQDTSCRSSVGSDNSTAEGDVSVVGSASGASETVILTYQEGATGENNAQVISTDGGLHNIGPQRVAGTAHEPVDSTPGNPVSAGTGMESDCTCPLSRETVPSTARPSRLSTTWNRLRSRFRSSDHRQAQQPFPLCLNRHALLLVYWLYTAVSVGCLYGWPAVSTLLLRQDAFAALCEGGRGQQCTPQQTAVASLFSLGCVLNCLMSAVGGAIYNRIGPRATAVLGQLTNMLGWVLLSYSSRDFSMHTAAIALIGATMNINLLPVLTVRGLFPGNENSIISLLGAAFTISSVMPRLILLVADPDCITTRAAILSYVLVALVPALFVACFLLPSSDFALSDTAEQPSIEPSSRPLLSEGSVDGFPQRRVRNSVFRLARGCRRLVNGCHVGRLFSVPFILATLYRSICNIGAGFYHQSAGSVLPQDVFNAVNYILPCGSVFCLAMGVAARRFSVVDLMAVVSLAGVLMYALPVWSSSTAASYLSAVFMSLFVACFSSQHLSLIQTLYGPHLFPAIAGWSVMLSGLLGATSTLLYTYGGSSSTIRIVFAFVFCLQFALPYLPRCCMRTGQYVVTEGSSDLALEDLTPSDQVNQRGADRTTGQGEDT